MSAPELNQRTINERIRRGWSDFDARNTPVGGSRPERSGFDNISQNSEPVPFYAQAGTMIAAIEASKKYQNAPTTKDGGNKYTDKIRRVLADLPQLGE